MTYLSPQIEALAKKKKQEAKSLVRKEHSCGIFQDYGRGELKNTPETAVTGKNE